MWLGTNLIDRIDEKAAQYIGLIVGTSLRCPGLMKTILRNILGGRHLEISLSTTHEIAEKRKAFAVGALIKGVTMSIPIFEPSEIRILSRQTVLETIEKSLKLSIGRGRYDKPHAKNKQPLHT